jgi:hypothetical protein
MAKAYGWENTTSLPGLQTVFFSQLTIKAWAVALNNTAPPDTIVSKPKSMPKMAIAVTKRKRFFGCDVICVLLGTDK